MTTRLVPHMSRPARVTRGLWPDRNPLRRPSDRAEAVMLTVLIMAFLVGAPLIALLAWRLAVGAAFTTTQAHQAGWRQVPAVLLTDEPNSGYYASPVAAAWTAPDGAQRKGMVYPSSGARAGATTPIWVNRAGRQMAWPLTPSQTRNTAVASAGMVVWFWAMLLGGAGMLGRHLMDTRRMAAWDAELRAAKLSGPTGASP